MHGGEPDVDSWGKDWQDVVPMCMGMNRTGCRVTHAAWWLSQCVLGVNRTSEMRLLRIMRVVPMY